MPAPDERLTQAQAAFAAGDSERARRLAEAVLVDSPQSTAALALLANAANAAQDFSAAAAALERLRALQPGNAGLRAAHALALSNAGSLLYRDGRLDAAAALYRRALDVDADNVLALTNLAACAERTRAADEAARCYGRLLRLEPRKVSVALGRSRALRTLGAHAEADAALREAERRATTVRDRREVGREYLRIGDAAAAERLFGPIDAIDDAALGAIARLQALCNDTAGARMRYAAVAQRAAGRGDERTRFRAERDGAVVLPPVPADAAALEQARAEYRDRITRLAGDWPPQRLQAAGVQLEDLACSRFLLGYHGGDDRPIAERYGAWLVQAAAACAPLPTVARARSASIRRVGLVSARWHQGTVAAYFGSWIGALRAGGHDVCFFSAGEREDATSAGLAAQASHAERLPRPLAAAAARLRDADLDLLIFPDVGLDAATEVLAALRLAPRQWAAWGHPVTTGLPTIDRFLSVETMEPPDAAAHYCEPLALLPGVGTCYAHPPRARAATRADFGLPDGPLYALPHAALKLHPDSDSLLTAIARSDRDARFLFVDDAVPAISRAYRTRVDAALRRAGFDPSRHCLNVPPLPIDGFRGLLSTVDVVLDSMYFSGGNTSLDALAQATPVVTIEGRFMRGRQTAAMLRLLDASMLIARDVEAAASIAVRVAHAPDERKDLSRRIADSAANLFDRTEPLQALCRLLDCAGTD